MTEFKKSIPPRPSPVPPQKGDPERKRLAALFLIPLVFFLILQLFVFPNIEVKRIPYSDFYQMVQHNPETHEITSAEMVEDVIRGKTAKGEFFQVNLPPNDPEMIPILRRNVPQFTVNPPQVFWRNLLYSVM